MRFFNGKTKTVLIKTFTAASLFLLFGSSPVQGSNPLSDFQGDPMFEPSRPEVCTVSVFETVDPLLARLVRLTPTGQCTGYYVPQTSPPETELCLFEGLGTIEYDDLDFSFDEFDGPIPVSVELESYILNKRATKYVERNIKILSVDIRERFTHWLARSGRYMRIMQNILREEGLPEDMVWLPLIESGFNTRAYSRSHAAGPWQFIKATGRRYGLKVDYWIDERRDPVKSTRAAARYLKDLYKMFDSWSLAMAAYNAGEGRIKRALKRTGTDDFWSLLKTRHIRNETKNYVPKFIAARMIAVEPEKYGIFNIKYHEDFTYDEVVLTAPISLDIAAKCAGTTTQAIKELNPELRRWSTPPVNKYTLRVPRGTRETFMAELDKLPRRKWVTAKVYTVKRGDTLSHISKRYGVPIRTIRDYNKINRRGLIRPGQKIIVPISLRKS